VEPRAGHPGVRLEVGGGRRVHADEHDRRAREQVGAVAERDAQRAAAAGHDQVEGPGGILPPEQLAQLGLGTLPSNRLRSRYSV
jgi:hypothetical protein